MEWSKEFTIDKKPSVIDIEEFINNPLWNELCTFIEQTYCSVPQIEFSKCSMATGWNVKYKKGSKSICTLYPNKNYFTCLLVIGSKEASESELILMGCDQYLQELYRRTAPFNGGRWLMIDVTTHKILNELKELILIRCKVKNKDVKANQNYY